MKYALTAWVLLGLLAAGCGPAPQQSTVITQEQAKIDLQNSRATSCEPGSEPWRSPGPPVRGSVLMRGHTNFEHLDWIKGGLAANGGIAQIYNTLVELRGCDFDDASLVPSLAKSWDISADGLTYTLSLRNDVKWHNKPPVNGRQFTAEDVAFTIDLQKAGGQLRSFWDDTTYEVRDPYTMVLKRTSPDPDFLDKIGEYRNVMVSREVKQQYGDFTSVAIGTGAFMLKEYRPNQTVVAERNPDYYEKGMDGRPLPYIDGYQSIVFPDFSAEVAALRVGQIDTVRSIGVRKHDADALRQQPNLTLRYYTQDRYSNTSFWFNHRKAPWNDVRVRKAFQLAINRDDLIASYQGAASHAGFLPPGFKEYLWPEEKLKEAFKPDPERARQLLSEAGFPPGTMKVTIPTSMGWVQTGEIVVENLKAIGVTASLESRGDSFAPILAKGEITEIGWGNLGSVQFPSYWLADIVKTGSSVNFLGFSDAKADQLAAALVRESDPVKRKELADQQQARLYEVMPWIPTVSDQFHRFESCRLRNSPRVSPNYNPRSVVLAWLDPAGC